MITRSADTDKPGWFSCIK